MTTPRTHQIPGAPAYYLQRPATVWRRALRRQSQRAEER